MVLSLPYRTCRLSRWAAVAACAAVIAVVAPPVRAQTAQLRFAPDGGPGDEAQFRVRTPPAPLPTLRQGLVLTAVEDGRAYDLADPESWSAGAAGAEGGEKIGVGWRRARLSALVGYLRPNGGPTDEGIGPAAPDRFKPRGSMGFGFALRY